MRSVVLVVFFTLLSSVFVTVAGAVDLASLPAERVDFTVLSYSPTEYPIMYCTPDGHSLPEENEISEGLKDGHLPDGFVSRLKALSAEDNLFLYVSAQQDPEAPGPTQDEFPLKELAEHLNKLPCRYVVTIIDLPTKGNQPGSVTVEEAASMARRCRMFKKGMTIFASRQFEQRLEDPADSTFAYYFYTGLQGGCANADEDMTITLWEAYAYAYWCTYASAVRNGGRPQCAVYVLTENWTAQPVMTKLGYYQADPDPQGILFAQSSLREPVGGILGPMGPSGPVGPSGPNWMSWYQGPAPRDARASLSDWAWHDLRVLERRCDELERAAAGLEEVRRSLPIGRPLPENRLTLPVGGYSHGFRGPMGLPAPISEKVRSAREEAVSSIPDAGNRSSAKANSDLLADLGMLAQKLEADACRAMDGMIGPCTYFPAGNEAAAYSVPAAWPEMLGFSLWPAGPVGPMGPIIRPADEPLELTDKAQHSLWSPGFANALASIRTRLERAQRSIEKPGWKR